MFSLREDKDWRAQGRTPGLGTRRRYGRRWKWRCPSAFLELPSAFKLYNQKNVILFNCLCSTVEEWAASDHIHLERLQGHSARTSSQEFAHNGKWVHKGLITKGKFIDKVTAVQPWAYAFFDHKCVQSGIAPVAAIHNVKAASWLI